MPLPAMPKQTHERNYEAEVAPLPPGLSGSAQNKLPAGFTAPVIQKPPTIEPLGGVAPRVPQAQLSPELEIFYMPGIISALKEGKIESLPDTKDLRRYVFSIYRGMTGTCGARSESAQLDGMGYVTQMVGGKRTLTEIGGAAALNTLLLVADIIKSNRIETIIDHSKEQAVETSEGIADGASFASQLGCNSEQYKGIVVQIEKIMRAKVDKKYESGDYVSFTALMNPKYREQLGIEDPAPLLQKRRIRAYTKQAWGACDQRYDSNSFCRCLFEKLQKSDLDESDWSAISFDFKNIVKVASTRTDVSHTIRSCVRG